MDTFTLTADQITALVKIGTNGYTVVYVRPQVIADDALTVRFTHPQRGDVVADIDYDGTVYPDSER